MESGLCSATITILSSCRTVTENTAILWIQIGHGSEHMLEMLTEDWPCHEGLHSYYDHRAQEFSAPTTPQERKTAASNSQALTHKSTGGRWRTTAILLVEAACCSLGNGPQASGQAGAVQVSKLLKLTGPCSLHLEFVPAKQYSPNEQNFAIGELMIFC